MVVFEWNLLDSLYIFFFFFSSRRRHTRLTCDWSSDVCSSDLAKSKPTMLLYSNPCRAPYMPHAKRKPDAQSYATNPHLKHLHSVSNSFPQGKDRKSVV